MLTLAIDTSTSAIGVAVLAPGADPVVGVEVDARAHTEKLAPLVRDTLAAAGATPADLTDIAVGTGPGPFTGLRVGLVTALTLGHALGIPVHGVCSLDALAEQALVAAPTASTRCSSPPTRGARRSTGRATAGAPTEPWR